MTCNEDITVRCTHHEAGILPRLGHVAHEFFPVCFAYDVIHIYGLEVLVHFLGETEQ